MGNSPSPSKAPLTPEFWNEAHSEVSVSLLGDTQAEDYAKLFNQVGPFTVEAENAGMVLEIGPGLGRWLASLPETTNRRAIEISPVNRVKLREQGVIAYSIEDHTQLDCARADLAVALSVFQHCTDAQVEEILKVVHASLRPGCSLYCNGIAVFQGYTLVGTGCVSLSRPLDAVLRMALRAGLLLTGVLEYPVTGMLVTAYLLRLTRL